MMKKAILTSFVLFFLILYSSSDVFAKKVKFSLDLTGITPNTTGVHVSGDFQEAAGYEGGNWQPGTTVLENEAGSSLYSVVVDIPANTKYEYKFLNGDQWYDVEFVPVESRVGYDFNDNRWFYLDSLAADTTFIGPIPFSGNAPTGTYLLRFRVDMQMQQGVSPDGVHVAGNFQGWDPNQEMMYSFDGNVYEYIAYIDEASPACSFRYANGVTEADYELVPGWCALEGNRHIALTEDTVLNTVCFGYCADCSTAGISSAGPNGASAVLSPNPATTWTTLHFNDERSGHDVMISDLLGKVQNKYTGLQDASLTIPTDGLNGGIYLVSILSGGSRISTLKLIITR